MRRLLAKRVKDLRRRMGLTQRELGDLLGVGNTTVSEWERMQVQSPVPDTLRNMGERLGLSLDWLFGDDDADMYAPRVTALRFALRRHLRDAVRPGDDPVRIGLAWLRERAPNWFTSQYVTICFPLPATGAAPSASVARLADVTGIPAKYWNSSAPSAEDMGADTPPPELARLYRLLYDQGVTVEAVHQSLLPADAEKKEAGQ